MTESYSASVKQLLREKSAQAFGLLGGEETKTDDCCKLSFFSALLLFGCEFRDDTVCFRVKNPALADLFISAGATAYSLTPLLCEKNACFLRDASFARLMRAAGIAFQAAQPIGLPLSVCGLCTGHFLRGVFLSCGTMSDPARTHQLNLATGRFSDELLALLQESGLNFRRATRRGRDYIYLKKASEIEDFLTLIGAEQFTIELINREIEGDIRARINRKNNFDTANIFRSTDFLTRLHAAIRTLEERGRLESLPENLKTIVSLRKRYPEDSLAELRQRLVVPLSKSGLYHRVKKIIDLAENKEV